LLFFSGIYFILFLISNGRWIGFGDVKMALWLGFTFGFKNSVDIFYLTFLFGFIIAIILLGFKKADLKTQVPLGLVMAGAGIFWLLAGFSILDLAGGELILRLWPNY
jgi:leader peptidase (prepilin peptidase) / N-methyltransferase